MDNSGETQVSLADPDARAMATTSRKPRVATEMALHVLAYNLKRGVAILGVPKLCHAYRSRWA